MSLLSGIGTWAWNASAAGWTAFLRLCHYSCAASCGQSEPVRIDGCGLFLD